MNINHSHPLLLRLAALSLSLFFSCFSAAASSKPDSTQTNSSTESVVRVFNRNLVTFRSSLSGLTPEERAHRTRRNVLELLDRHGQGTVTIKNDADTSQIMLDGVPALRISDADADSISGETRDAMANRSADALRLIVQEKLESQDTRSLLTQLGYAIAATLFAALLAYGLHKFYRMLAMRVLLRMGRAVKNLKPADNVLMLGDRAIAFSRFLLSSFYWCTAALLAYEWISFVLGRFPYTRAWGEQLNTYLLDSILLIVTATASAIPNLFVAGMVFLLARTATRMLHPLFDRVAQGHMSFGLLDRDTAIITRRLSSIIIWLFALAMAFPYLPGAQTEAFRGMSVLIGLMVSLGASSVVGQAAGGLILMYTRSLRVGEHVNISGHEGTVSEIGLFTTRIRTGLGEEVSLPNSMIIGTASKNYSRAAQGSGFVLDTTVTIGYDTPWRQVEAMLTEAARRTNGIQTTPAPRVFQTALSDFYPEYRLVCQAVPERPRPRAEVLSSLHANIQDVFNEYGVQIMSPHYLGDPENEKTVPKARWHLAPSAPEKP